jgi:hypothetical protein
MYPEEYVPTKIGDIVSRMPEYVVLMESLNEDELHVFILAMKEYVMFYMTEQRHDKVELKRIAVGMVNELYVLAHEMDYGSEYALCYSQEVLADFFVELIHYDIFIAFVVDGDMPDAFFLFVYSLFNHASFSVITPYHVSNREETFAGSYDVTVLQARTYREVEVDIYFALKQLTHFIYIEKDSSVSYMHKMLDIMETIRGGYQCVYRNKPYPFAYSLWIHGAKREMVG